MDVHAQVAALDELGYDENAAVGVWSPRKAEVEHDVWVPRFPGHGDETLTELTHAVRTSSASILFTHSPS